MSDDRPKPKHPPKPTAGLRSPQPRMVTYGQEQEPEPKRPPRKWELWGAIFLLVIWSSNAAAGNLENRQGTNIIVNDLMLVGGICWLISVLVRRNAYKRSQDDQ